MLDEIWWPLASFQLITPQHHTLSRISPGAQIQKCNYHLPFFFKFFFLNSLFCLIPVKELTKLFPETTEIRDLLCVSARELTWQELDLLIERPPALLHQKGPLDGALTLLYGLLVGFGSALLAAVAVILVIARASRRTPPRRSARPTSAG